MAPLSHIDAQGRVRMVDVGAKAETEREAVARGLVRMAPATLKLLQSGKTPKGNVLATAHIAAVMAAKRTSDWIPLTHTLNLDAVDVAFSYQQRPAAVTIEVKVRTTGRTGVEMEALTAVAAAGLTLVDMLKAVDRTLVIGDIALWEKRGGRSGEWKHTPTSAGSAPKPRPAAASARHGTR